MCCVVCNVPVILLIFSESLVISMVSCLILAIYVFFFSVKLAMNFSFPDRSENKNFVSLIFFSIVFCFQVH